MVQQGLLSIPDVGDINVKQGRAFLWNALWLQKHMNKLWEQDTVFQAPTRLEKLSMDFTNYHLVIVGPSGTGKTAILKVTEALINFFAGPPNCAEAGAFQRCSSPHRW